MSASKTSCCVSKRSVPARCTGRALTSHSLTSKAADVQGEDSGVHLDESPVLACATCDRSTHCHDCSACHHRHADSSKLAAFSATDAATTARASSSLSPTSSTSSSAQRINTHGAIFPRCTKSCTTSYISASPCSSTGSDAWMTSSSSSRLCHSSAGSDDVFSSGVGTSAIHSSLTTPYGSTVTVKVHQSGPVPTVVEFSVGPAGDPGSSDGESTSSAHFAIQSAPDDQPISSGNRKSRDSRGDDHKMRFKKFFAPLRRSHSAGNKTDISAYSLFKHREQSDSDDQQIYYQVDDRCSVDTGRGSLEPSSFDRECEETHHLITVTCRETKKKSLTTEVKEKFHVFRRRYTDIALSSKETKADKMSIESVKNWSKSFDVLLADKNGLHCFREFLKSEFSDENIEFWIACEEYKNLKANNLLPQAQKIFAEFVAYQAPREINIDSKTRELTYSNMSQPDNHAFDMAQKRIQALMDKDSYPRFLESEVYLQLVGGGGGGGQKTLFT